MFLCRNSTGALIGYVVLELKEKAPRREPDEAYWTGLPT